GGPGGGGGGGPGRGGGASARRGPHLAGLRPRLLRLGLGGLGTRVPARDRAELLLPAGASLVRERPDRARAIRGGAGAGRAVSRARPPLPDPQSPPRLDPLLPAHLPPIP